MVFRIFFSLVLGFALSAVALLVLPDLGRVAGRAVCDGRLAPSFERARLEYRCAHPDGSVSAVKSDHVITRALPVVTLALLPLTSAAIWRRSRRVAEQEGSMEQDLRGAVTARAEILRLARDGNMKRQLLLRAAELRLVLWVQPPDGRPYEATVPWLVDEQSLRRVSVGALVPVRVNPGRPERVYPAEPWAHYDWWRG